MKISASKKPQILNTDVSEVTDPDFRCKFCNSVFTSQKSLKQHILNLHKEKYYVGNQDLSIPQNTMPEKFQCKICNVTYSKKAYLDMHMPFHKNTMDSVPKSDQFDTKMPCEKCEKTFSFKYDLERQGLSL